MGMGPLSLRCLLRRRLGVVHLPGHARTRLPLPLRMAFGKFVAHSRLADLRRTLRHRGAHRTCRAGSPSLAWNLYTLSPLPFVTSVESTDGCCCTRRHGSVVTVADSQL